MGYLLCTSLPISYIYKYASFWLLRDAVILQEIGFLTPKPVVYVANVPAEAGPSIDSNDDEEPKDVSESAKAISRVALAHADTVVGLRRDYGVPAVVGCLRNLEGQNALGAAVRLC